MGEQAAIYVRISRDKAGQEAGVERQEADCRALAERYGYEVVAVYKDNDFGASKHSRKKRPQYRAMLDAAGNGQFGAILAYTNSRLTRRPAEWEELIRLTESKHPVQVRTVNSGDANFTTADGRAIARTYAAWDAAEAERIAERVQRAKKEARAAGKWLGGPRPFGYKVDGFTIEEREAEAIRWAARQVIEGRSLNSLARELAESGFTTSSAKKPQLMHQIALRRILIRPRNAGFADPAGTVEAEWAPILTEDVWRTVRGILEDPSRRTQTSSAVRWLGSHLYRCGVCGRVLRPASTGGVGRPRRTVYRCSSGKHIHRDQAGMDAFVREVIALRLSKPDLRGLLPVAAIDAERVEVLKANLRMLRTRTAQLGTDYAEGLLTGQQTRLATMKLEHDIAGDEFELERLGRTSVLQEFATASDPARRFLDANVEKQRAVVALLLEVRALTAPRGRPVGHKPGTPYFSADFIDLKWK
ncbi:recombinase family protein [Arthrobacter rhombi]|uniref:Probable phiRv1 integrase n=1 Tax=Arthrobacter rhombi TaxID=71253 RepID=A0A1R4FQ66_9MICC|nr:recombinase family protein [Arthrobacter rhombi]SJM57882.1 Probable phiRv1 integrase [Arthrobacter rhombi]